MARRVSRRRLLALAAVVIVATGVTAALANLTQVPVKTQPNPIRERGPGVSASYFAWAQSSAAHPHTYNLYEQAMSTGAPTGPVAKVNVSGSSVWDGGSVSNTRLAYQQIVGGQSDIRFFNLALHQHSNPPTGVNSLHWEYEPRLGPSWIMFGRYVNHTSRVLLLNLSTSSVRVLFSVQLNSKGTAFVDPGQVNGDFATFDVCTAASNCSVYLYTISTRTLVHVTPPTGMLDYSPAVSATGTVYFGRSGPGCGTNAQLMQLPLGGTPATINTFSPGNDVAFLQTYNDGTNDQLFYTRFVCTTDAEDIYRVTAP